MIRMASVMVAAMLVAGLMAGVAAAQTGGGMTGGTGTSPRPGTEKEADKGPEQYRSTGPGASLMSPGERRQMDQCTKFASWDHCKREMLGP